MTISDNLHELSRIGEDSFFVWKMAALPTIHSASSVNILLKGRNQLAFVELRYR